MILVTVVLNGETKLVLKGLEPKDNTALGLVLEGTKKLAVTKENDSYVLAVEKKDQESGDR